ncbi:uncharacterized protein LOC115890347 [Sitophilus oryzae]|uniref:Uncharacterized protein LOC115890347 n=1 Tax=Sitophilus oryzae TaxID=7048 RepID=A0A6J2YQS6_SITOR|nr:uncharacterized protein LOC115890347 [Sitophilus oryzae]
MYSKFIATGASVDFTEQHPLPGGLTSACYKYQLTVDFACLLLCFLLYYKGSTMSSKRPLTDQELLDIIDQMSDIEGFDVEEGDEELDFRDFEEFEERDPDENQGEIHEEGNAGEEEGKRLREEENVEEKEGAENVAETEGGGLNNQAGSTNPVAEQTATVRISKAQVKQFCNENGLTYKEDIRWRRGITYITPPLPWHIPKQSNIIEILSPYKYFSQYFTQDLLNTIVEMTNLFAVQNNVHNFPATNVSEIKTLLGISVVHILCFLVFLCFLQLLRLC